MDKKVIHSVFEEVVKKLPANIAIESEQGTISYVELNKYSNRLSHLLYSLCDNHSRIVVVIGLPSIELVSIILSVFKSGNIYLPVDLSFSEKRLTQIFNETFEGVIVVVEELYNAVIYTLKKLNIKTENLIVVRPHLKIELLESTGSDFIKIDVDEPGEWEGNLLANVNGETSNYIFYTSGSTGDGKAILGKNASLSHFVHWEIKEFGINESFRLSQLASVTFDASLRDIFVALISGGILCIPSKSTKENPDRLLKWIDNSKVNLIHTIPSLFRVMLNELESENISEKKFQQVRFIMLAGEMIYAKDIHVWRKIMGDRINLVNFYGPTETTLIKSFYRIGYVSPNPADIIPVGVPISNTSIAVVKEQKMCIVGEIGEIYIKTPFSTKGYFQNEHLTSQYFVSNPLTKDSQDIVYRTGDIGRYLKDGNIEILGRKDGQFKINGIRAEMGEIERAMLENDSIAEAIVKTFKAEDNLLTIIAYYTGVELSEDIIREKLKKTLNYQLIPSYFIYLKKFPLTLNGKVDKKALPIPEEALNDNKNYQAPVGILENKLAELWMELLGLERVGRNISFFSVGGHSLRAIQLVSKIHKTLSVELKIADIFGHRTIMELASFIEELPENHFHSIVPVQDQPFYLLSSSQKRLWIQSQFLTENVTFNISGIYMLEGNVDVVKLETAFQKLLERHEILRTVFVEDKMGEVRQQVKPAGENGFKIMYNNLRKLNIQNQRVIELISAETSKPFNLGIGPLLRVNLFQLEEEKWLFIYVMHHIVSDDWSMGIFLKELLVLYNSDGKEKRFILPSLKIQYRDYAGWQQEQLLSPHFDIHKLYWIEQFSGKLPVLTLFGHEQRPNVKTHNGKVLKKTLDYRSTVDLNKFCDDHGGTLFMGLLTIVNTLLYKYSHQEDIIVGTPVSGRVHSDTEDQIGFYVNTLALRTRFSRYESFSNLFDNIKNTTLSAFEHQIYPFDELIDSLNPPRDLGRNLLFDVWVVLHENEILKSYNLMLPDDLKISSYQEELRVFAKFDLLFSFTETEGELMLNLEFNTDIFNSKDMENLMMNLERIVKYGCRNKNMSILEIETCIEEENKFLHNLAMRDIKNKDFANLLKK